MNITNKFVHLRNYTQYSLSRGALRIHEIINFCKQQKMPAIAISDFNNLFGCMEFSIDCQTNGIQPIIGCNVNIVDNKFRQGKLLLLSKTEKGYSNLSQLISRSYLKNSSTNNPFINLEDLKNYSEGLICLGGGETGLVTKNYERNFFSNSKEIIEMLNHIFADNFFIEIQRNKSHNFLSGYEDFLLDISEKRKIPLVATNENYFLEREFQKSHDVLLCISQQKYLEDENRFISKSDFYMKNIIEMNKLFSDIPEACENTVLIARKCSFILEEKSPILPKINLSDKDEALVLREKSFEGLKDRKLNFSEIKNNFSEYEDRLNFELKTIISMGYSSYFLIVADFINWAKKSNIPVGPGRGSGAGSLVAWCLSITNLDPIKFGLLFERFLNPERVSLPDFDIDFCMEKRDDVINYVQKKYGQSNVAQIITFGSFQPRAAVRDVGRVIQMPLQQIDEICKMIPYNPSYPQTLKEYIDEDKKIQKIIKNDFNVKKLFEISQKLEGLLRHASTHAAGIVISDKPLDKILPLYKDPKSQFPVTQFSMKYVEKTGLIKFDFLGLKTLTVINETCKYLKLRSIKINIDRISLNDKATFDLLKSGFTVGIFQLEGQGMRETLIKVKPDRFEDLIAIVSLYRPGPMDNIPTYINRKQNNETYSYAHSYLENILDETYGIMVYQEQVMLIAQKLAGFSLAKADLLRRAMGKKIKSEMKAQKINFVEGCVKNKVDKVKASELFDEIEKFAGYGFNKSHAAAYAMIAYQTAFLKANYPVEFFCALMNCDIGNVDKLSLYCHEVKKIGFKIFSPDINESDVNFKVVYDNMKSPIGINFGLSAIKNVGENSINQIVIERKNNGNFKSILDILKRLNNSILNKRIIEALIFSGSFKSIEDNQNYLEKNSERILSYNSFYHKNNNFNQTSLFDESSDDLEQFNSQNFKYWDINTKLKKEIESFGFYLSEHPTKFYESFFDSNDFIKLTDLIEIMNNGNNNKLFSSLVLIDDLNERVSKIGKKFAFIGFSDSTATIDSICFSEILDKYGEQNIKIGEIYIAKFKIQSFKDSKRFIVQDLNRLDYKSFEKKNYILKIDIKNVDFSLLKKLFETCSKGNCKLTFKLFHQNHEIEIKSKNSFNVDMNFLSKVDKISGISNIKLIN